MAAKGQTQAHLGVRSGFAAFLLAAAIVCIALCSCAAPDETARTDAGISSEYLTILDEEPDSLDPQLISEDYTVALNVFDRLVEVVDEGDGNVLGPSLAESWTVSDDGLVYTFKLREGVTFSNGSPLTSSDVGFTLSRLITHPDSRNRDLALDILGASALHEGAADDLAGFKEIDDLSFSITLERPSAPFLEGLSTPGASILDEQTVTELGDAFGSTVEDTVGTGPFVVAGWNAGKEIVLTANKSCWLGAPKCAGVRIMFYTENDPLLEMYESGQMDILDLDKLGMDAEYFLRGDKYRRNIVRGQRVGISYIALNESIGPLSDARVRKALQLSLDRQTMLQAAIGGRGTLENGIFPRGLTGHNNDLAEIPYDPDEARRLLEEAGYGNGFDLELSYSSSSPQSVKDTLELAASMWGKIGVDAALVELDDDEFLARRRAGELACYTGTWSADYNDPDNFVTPFFGSAENTVSRSLCYEDWGCTRNTRWGCQDCRIPGPREEDRTGGCGVDSAVVEASLLRRGRRRRGFRGAVERLVEQPL